MPARRLISLTARLRRVKLFLTDVDGGLVGERRLVAGFAGFERPKPVTDRRSIDVARSDEFGSIFGIGCSLFDVSPFSAHA